MGELLDHIDSPADLNKLNQQELNQLAQEIRTVISETVAKNGGHLASNLGIVELSLALHHCFDFRYDRILWDVGHQCYTHKLVTGRRKEFQSIRLEHGLSGFPDVNESPYDAFTVGHAGTAVSTALGMALAKQLRGQSEKIVAVVGDAGVTNGLSFEGLNNAHLIKRQLLVVLNDNSMAIDVTQGSMAKYLVKIRLTHTYEDMKKTSQHILTHLPVLGQPLAEALVHIRQGLKTTLWPGQIFEPLGLRYFGPVDGHDLNTLIDLLNRLKQVDEPVLLHVITEKGKGFEPAQSDPRSFHSTKPFHLETGKVLAKSGEKTYSDAFAESLIKLAKNDQRIVAITAAMPDGTGLNKFAEQFPERMFDVGICESHAVAMAAGLAKEGFRPVVAIYSSFLQRSLDQIFQEVALQNLPVVLAIDRAGVVGGDGPTHQGFMDIAFLRSLPRMVCCSPADAPEMEQALDFALRYNGPVALRYPRAEIGENLGPAEEFRLGKSRSIRQGKDLCIVAYGECAQVSLEAAKLLAKDGIEAAVINARFVKPLDSEALKRILKADRPVLVVEDHALIGGLATAIQELAGREAIQNVQIIALGLPDSFLPHGTRETLLKKIGLDAEGIRQAGRKALLAKPKEISNSKK
ncbi:MAG: 1-deoxy-D-xylulose-5-phosphate synthase [Actinobacteria bacterium]|nr:1-deoxy-D-xylulose-5-phosphate synthase [Actinomycetota bacterium]